MKKQIQAIREGLRRFNRRAGVLKADPYGVGLSLSQCSALVDIERYGELRAQELVRTLCLDKSTVSRLVAALENEGLVTFSDDPEDRRSRLLKLSSDGKRVVNRINKESDEMVAEVFAHLNESERDQLAKSFESLMKAIDGLDLSKDDKKAAKKDDKGRK